LSTAFELCGYVAPSGELPTLELPEKPLLVGVKPISATKLALVPPPMSSTPLKPKRLVAKLLELNAPTAVLAPFLNLWRFKQ